MATGSYQWHADRAAAEAVRVRRLMTETQAALDDLLSAAGAYHTATEREMARIQLAAARRVAPMEQRAS